MRVRRQAHYRCSLLSSLILGILFTIFVHVCPGADGFDGTGLVRDDGLSASTLQRLIVAADPLGPSQSHL